MSGNHINMDMVREARKNLEQIAKDHPELTNLSDNDAQRLLEGVFDVMVDKDKMTFTLAETAEILSLHKETLRRAILAGKLKAAKTGKDYRISREDLKEYWKVLGGGILFKDEENT